MQVDSGKTTADNIVKVGDVNVVIKDVGKKTMVSGKSAQINSQKRMLANDHETSSSGSASKYHQPRWCPPGLIPFTKEEIAALKAPGAEEARGREAQG